MPDIEHILLNYSLKLLLLGTVSLAVIAFVSLKATHLTEKWKELLFFSIVAATIVPTLFIAGATIYINNISSSGGPVHWHADLDVFACGKEINLRDPKGLNNKIGTPTLHEHNDKRIHVEGVVLESQNVSLGKFFNVIGGELTDAKMIVPTNEGNVTYENGQECTTGDKGEVQLFVYTTDGEGYYTQEKVVAPQKHVLAPFSGVPAGDCMILEFGTAKEKTDKICRSYAVAEKIGKLKGERK